MDICRIDAVNSAWYTYSVDKNFEGEHKKWFTAFFFKFENVSSNNCNDFFKLHVYHLIYMSVRGHNDICKTQTLHLSRN